jgi:hypothetical protein
MLRYTARNTSWAMSARVAAERPVRRHQLSINGPYRLSSSCQASADPSFSRTAKLKPLELPDSRIVDNISKVTTDSLW